MNTTLKHILSIWLLILLFTILRSSIFLQNGPHPSFKMTDEDIGYCATDAFLRLNPDLKHKQKEIEARLYTDFKTGRKNGLRTTPPYVLPVIVHIIHQNGEENITDAQVLQGITDLNEAFANINYYDQNTGVNTHIQFCLAKQTPEGAPTTGINRVVSSLTNITMETEDVALKNLIRWSPRYYINIWLVAEIYSDAFGVGVGAYATFPFGHGSNSDGIVEEARYFGSSSASSSVQVHEMGHYLGLYHTFQGACANNDCMINGDRICDTPPDNSTAGIACNGVTNSCDTDSNSGFTTDQNDQFWNYMDYGKRACYSAFTNDQKERMHWFIENIRSPLLESRACNEPCMVDITAAFLPDANQVITIGTTLNFTNTSTFANSYEWQIDGTSFAISNNANYTFNTLGTYEISLMVNNNDPNCSSDFSIFVEVVCPVTAEFEISNLYPTPGEIVTFTNQSTHATDYNWQVNGVSEENTVDFSYVFPSTGTYTICLESANDFCNKTFCQTIYMAYYQSECISNTFMETIGRSNEDERSYTIIPSGDGNFYIGASKEHQLMLVKVNADGTVLWERFFTIDNDVAIDEISQLLLDVEGNLVIIGYGGENEQSFQGFVLKYDPITNTVLWTQHFNTQRSTRMVNIVEVSTTDYILTGDFSSNTALGDEKDPFFIKLNKNTGELTDFSPKAYTLGTLEDFNAIEEYNDELYIAGRYTNPAGDNRTRFSLTKMDMDGNELWSKLYHKSMELTARLSAQDLLIENQSVYMLGHGTDNALNLTNSYPFLVKTDIEGSLAWVRKYLFSLETGGSNQFIAHQITSVSDGFLLLGSSKAGLPSLNDIYLLKTDKNGVAQWMKVYRYIGGFSDAAYAQFLVSGNRIYIVFSFVNILTSGNDEIFLLKTDLQGNVAEDCILGMVEVAVEDFYVEDPIAINVNLTASDADINLLQSGVTIDTSVQSFVEGCYCLGEGFPCETTFVKTIGTADKDESGRQIITEPNGGFLLAATNGDSTLLLMLDAESEIIWQRAFNFLPADEEIKDMFIDADGYLVAVGFNNEAGGDHRSFVLKYDYINDNMLWVQELAASSLEKTNLFSIVETNPGSNYFVVGNSSNNASPGGGGDGLLLEIDKITGNGLWYQNYHRGSEGVFSKLMPIANSLYIFGHNNFVDGAADKTRAAISQFDLSGNEIWSKLYLVSPQQNAQLYAVDAVSDNGLVCISHGSLSSTNIDDFNVQLFKTDYLGNIQWAKNYTIATDNERESAKKILPLPDGYLILGEYKTGNVYSIFILKTDKNGLVEWAKKYGSTNEDRAYDLLYQNGLIYLLGGSATYGLNGTSDILLAKLNQDGSVLNDCMLIEDLLVTQTDITNPYDGDHPLLNYPAPLSLTSHSITTNETVLEEQLECYVPCLEMDSCLILPDAAIVLSSVTCLGDSLLVEMEICNLFNGILPQGTPISFYDDDPRNTPANLLTVIEFNHDLLLDECIIVSKKIPTTSTTNIYAIMNDAGTNSTPFTIEMDLPNTPVSECDFLNNISQIDIVYTPPLLDLGADTTLCDNATLNFDAGSGFYAYSWFDGSHGQTYTAWNAGTYWVETVDSCGGVQIDSITITILPESRLEVGADTIVCPGATVSISVNGFDEYQWFPVDKIDCDTCSTVVVMVDTSLLVEVVGRKTPGCFSVDTILIDVFLPIMSHDTLLECEGDTALVFGQPQTVEGDYSQTFTATNGCDSIHTTSLFFTTDTLFTSNNLTICQGDSIEIFGQMETREGVYIQVNDSGNCVKTSTIDLEVKQKPNVNLLIENISCFGEQDGIISIETSETGLLFSLDDEDYQEESTFNSLPKGDYELYMQTIDNCIFTYAFSISEPDELFLFLPEDRSIHLGDVVHIMSFTNGDSLLYFWSPLDWLSCLECLQPTARPLKTITYTLNIADQNGCTAEDEMLIMIDNSPRIYIPNVFSPNGDGVNDVFFINANNDVAEILKFQIFDRWGELVFEDKNFAPNSAANGWNGQFRGSAMGSAVFAYYAEVLFIDARIEMLRGDVLLLR